MQKATLPARGSPQPVTQSVLPDSKTIVLVIDADAQKSEVVNDVIAALEKAGIATGKAAETAPPLKLVDQRDSEHAKR